MVKVKESQAQKITRGREILRRLRDEFPELFCPLTHDTPFQLLVATILSAQCTDVRVNLVTPALFRAAPTPEAMVKLGERKIRSLIKSINFFNTKAKNIFNSAKIIIKEHGSQVPTTLEALVELPGVGRKTANVVLGNAFSTPGMVVDTHVKRLANRLAFCRSEDPVEIEHDLEKLFAPQDWVDLSHALIFHGRKTCTARRPLCERCDIASFCPSKFQDQDAWKVR